jgi:hypothetical protein
MINVAQHRLLESGKLLEHKKVKIMNFPQK